MRWAAQEFYGIPKGAKRGAVADAVQSLHAHCEHCQHIWPSDQVRGCEDCCIAAALEALGITLEQVSLNSTGEPRVEGNPVVDGQEMMGRGARLRKLSEDHGVPVKELGGGLIALDLKALAPKLGIEYPKEPDGTAGGAG
jgi:hypothetical protein